MRGKLTNIGIFGVYYLMLGVYMTASYFPEYRVWGFNWWAYYPDWIRWWLFGIGAFVPVALRFIPQTEVYNSDHIEKADTNDRKFFIYVGVITAVFGSLFYLLRARTHFLGDGYTLLSSLASDSPLAMKTREYGESLLHILLKNVIGGDGQAAALLSYQIISITSGLLFVVVVAMFARKLFERMAERVLFLLGVCTGGYMLLFFGYVENYSLFVLSVLTYTLTGLLITQGKARHYWILPTLFAAVFFHVLGITLLPSALYLFISRTRFGRTIREWRPLTKLIALFPILVVTAIVFYHFYTTNYFFQFAFVPLFENQFTVEGYTMFSWKHLIDFANLLFLLVPGLLILFVALASKSLRRSLKQKPNIYLLILTSSVLGAVFIFDPKLGMPRDWDLFSFAGVPVAVSIYSFASLNWQSNRMRNTAVLSIILCLFILVPRAVNGFQESAGLNHYRSYLLLDIAKCRNGWIYIINFYRDQGNTVLADGAFADWRALHPEVGMIKAASRLLLTEKKIKDAMIIGQDVIRKAPTYPDGYALLGVCNIQMHKYTEALSYLKIADGLSPDRSTTLNNLGHTYYNLGDYENAEAALLRALQLDTTDISPVTNLVRLYRDQLRFDMYEQNLSKAASHKQSSASYVREWGDYLLTKRQFSAAADAYRRAMEKGLDSSYLQQLMEQYPDLRKFLE